VISLSDLHARCLEILDELPKGRFTFRPRSDPHGPLPTEAELFAMFWNLDAQHRARIDTLLGTLVLDWRSSEQDGPTWFLVEQRVRAAVYLLEHLLQTLSPQDAYLPIDDPDDALEWALIRLWPFAGALWSQRAARLLAAGMDLSSRSSPPPLP